MAQPPPPRALIIITGTGGGLKHLITNYLRNTFQPSLSAKAMPYNKGRVMVMMEQIEIWSKAGGKRRTGMEAYRDPTRRPKLWSSSSSADNKADGCI